MSSTAMRRRPIRKRNRPKARRTPPPPAVRTKLPCRGRFTISSSEPKHRSEPNSATVQTKYSPSVSRRRANTSRRRRKRKHSSRGGFSEVKMDTRNSSNDFVLVFVKRIGLILILSATFHSVTRNFFQPTFLHFAVFYCSCVLLSLVIFPHKSGGLHSYVLYGLFGLGLAVVRTSDLIGYTGSRSLGLVSMFIIGVLIALLTLGLDLFLNRRSSDAKGI